MELKYFFAKGTATVINGPEILNSDPKNSPDGTILEFELEKVLCQLTYCY